MKYLYILDEIQDFFPENDIDVIARKMLYLVDQAGRGETIPLSPLLWCVGQMVKISACHAAWSGFNSRTHRSSPWGNI